MFDMQKIGKKIAALRREKGMTQMELADKMNISYQAVSNWERGNTMPDISKLPELAEIFGVSMEELLCDERKAKIVEEIAEGKAPADLTPSELTDVAPIITREQFKKTCSESGSKRQWKISDLAALAPFMEEEDIARFAREILAEGATLKEIVPIAPFMAEKDIGELALAAAEQGGISDLAGLAPFLSEAHIGRIVGKLSENGEGLAELAAFAPFMSAKDLSGIAKDYLERGGDLKGLTAIVPFLDSAALKDLFKK